MNLLAPTAQRHSLWFDVLAALLPLRYLWKMSEDGSTVPVRQQGPLPDAADRALPF
jgi:hypothetical protein